jgi:hypothetical protein
MLLPDQVIPFLLHDDPIVRRHARNYFDDTFEFGSLTADHFWAVLDRFGEIGETLGVAAGLGSLPQTEESVQRLIRALSIETSEKFRFHYQHAARDLSFEFLERHREALLGCPALEAHIRAHLELRLRLRDDPPDVVWERLMERGRKLGHAHAASFSSSEPEAEIEAAARGGAAVCERAMSAMKEESAIEDWRAIFAARVLGEARFEPAIDALVETLAVDADVLPEEVSRSLSRIGTPAVVEKILAFYPGQPWYVRLYAHLPLENIKLPASETALLKLLEIEQAIEADPNPDEEEGDPLSYPILIGLTQLCSLAGLEPLRRALERDPQDLELQPCLQGLLATALMFGVSLPEESSWRAAVKEYEKKAAGMLEAMERTFESQRQTHRQINANLGAFDDDDDAGGFEDPLEAEIPVPPQFDANVRPMQPIRNTSPKIGRNDPCPCGSGKKYKKCCGNK